MSSDQKVCAFSSQFRDDDHVKTNLVEVWSHLGSGVLRKSKELALPLSKKPRSKNQKYQKRLKKMKDDLYFSSFYPFFCFF